MGITDYFPGMQAGNTKRNVIIGTLYVFFFWLLPIVFAYTVATNQNGVADKLSSVPGINSGGGVVSGIVILIIGYMFVGVLFAAGGDPDTNQEESIDEADEEEPEERSEMDESKTNDGEEESSDEVATDESDDDPSSVDSEDNVETAMSPPYHVEEIADLSYAGVVRTEASVVPEQEVQELDEEELRLIAEEVVEDITDEEDVNAIVVFFYDPGADIEYAAEAKFEWAPNGNWEDAGDVDTGDYTAHEYHFERFTEQVERTELEERFNEPEELNVETAHSEGPVVQVEMWQSSTDESGFEEQVEATVSVFSDLVDENAELERMEVTVRNPLSEEIESEYYVLAEWFDDDDVNVMDRTMDTVEESE